MMKPVHDEGRDCAVPTLRNFRDIGGLRTLDGRRVRTGLLFRSATPVFLTERESRWLVDDLGLRLRIDLRSRSEVTQESSRELGRRERRVLNLPIGAGEQWKRDERIDALGERVAAYYLRFLQHTPRSFVAAVSALAAQDGVPALVHCTAGKDRTGVLLAVLLAAIGISHDDIVADYARTAPELPALFAQLRQLPGYQERIAVLPEESHTADPESMIAFLKGLQGTYGGAADYLRRSGATDEMLDALSRKLLEPATISA